MLWQIGSCAGAAEVGFLLVDGRPMWHPMWLDWSKRTSVPSVGGPPQLPKIHPSHRLPECPPDAHRARSNHRPSR